MSIHDEQRRYFGELWKQHGEDPRAVGYRDAETQRERFERLALAFAHEAGPFSVHEIGCGLGDFGLYLRRTRPQVEYSGSEIHEPFLEVCRRRLPDCRFYDRDVARELPPERYDFVTQSGMFNARLDTPPEEWRRFVFGMLGAMYAMARKGIAFNFLTTYCDRELMREELHYQEPREISDFVVQHLSRHFEIDAAGPLYEYTVRVYRPEYVRGHYPGAPFSRYFKDRG